MKKQQGIADFIMLALVLTISILASLQTHQFTKDIRDNQDNLIEREVMKEALQYEKVSRAVQQWFNLKGKGLIYACESTTPNCDTNVRKEILPAYYSQLVTDSFISAGTIDTLGMTSPFPFRATVVKKNDVPTGYDYEIIISYQ